MCQQGNCRGCGSLDMKNGQALPLAQRLGPNAPTNLLCIPINLLA